MLQFNIKPIHSFKCVLTYLVIVKGKSSLLHKKKNNLIIINISQKVLQFYKYEVNIVK